MVTLSADVNCVLHCSLTLYLPDSMYEGVPLRNTQLGIDYYNERTY